MVVPVPVSAGGTAAGLQSVATYADSSGDIRGNALPQAPATASPPPAQVSGPTINTVKESSPPVVRYPFPLYGRVGNQAALTRPTRVPLPSPASGSQTVPLPSRGATGQGGGGATLLPYTVRPGDTVYSIARAYGISAITVISANAIADPNLIRVGERLVIPSQDGLFHRVVPGETLVGIAELYGVQMGAVAEANHIADPNRIYPGQLLFILGIPPVARGAGLPGTPADGGGSARTGEYAWPVYGRITSYFGQRHGELHTGLDIAAASGTPIRAARAGTVIQAGWLPGHGYTVILRHDDQSETLYAHASRLLVRTRQKVEQGTVVARVGMTGNATGPHLHFELLLNGHATDPLNYLPPR